jgi:hypothetical protein
MEAFMQHRRLVLGAMMAVLLLGLLSGCTGMSATMQPIKDSGFLPHYDWMKPDPAGGEIWRKPDANLAKYNKILLERIKVWYKDDAVDKEIDPATLKMLVDYFRQSIVKALGNAYPVVNETGPDVMRVRIAITQLVPTQTELSVVALVAPYGEVPDIASGAVSKGGFGSAPYLGDAAIEAMGLDSMTTHLLWEYMDRRIGKKYDVDLNKGVTGAVTTGFKQYGEGFITWGYTKEAMDYWALLFRERLDVIHGKKKGNQ